MGGRLDRRDELILGLLLIAAYICMVYTGHFGARIHPHNDHRHYLPPPPFPTPQAETPKAAGAAPFELEEEKEEHAAATAVPPVPCACLPLTLTPGKKTGYKHVRASEDVIRRYMAAFGARSMTYVHFHRSHKHYEVSRRVCVYVFGCWGGWMDGLGAWVVYTCTCQVLQAFLFTPRHTHTSSALPNKPTNPPHTHIHSQTHKQLPGVGLVSYCWVLSLLGRAAFVAIDPLCHPHDMPALLQAFERDVPGMKHYVTVSDTVRALGGY
jgi:hypothetical protein